MNRFVVLYHTDWPGQPDHYDLMLELGEYDAQGQPALRTYSTRDATIPAPGVPLHLNALHRLIYLDYEGPLSAGRGRVSRAMSGLIDTFREDASTRGLVLHLKSERLNGVFVLRAAENCEYSLQML